jgi:hypothetical protein
MRKTILFSMATLFLAGMGMADTAGAGKTKKQQNGWPHKHTQASKKNQKKPNSAAVGKTDRTGPSATGSKPALNPQPMPPGAKAGMDRGEKGNQAQ